MEIKHFFHFHKEKESLTNKKYASYGDGSSSEGFISTLAFREKTLSLKF